jgi:hypothetical protein
LHFARGNENNVVGGWMDGWMEIKATQLACLIKEINDLVVV